MLSPLPPTNPSMFSNLAIVLAGSSLLVAVNVPSAFIATVRFAVTPEKSNVSSPSSGCDSSVTVSVPQAAPNL